MSDKTTHEVYDPKVTPPNPTGKGGFADNPTNRSPGGWKPENTISYQYRRFMHMTPKELKDWIKTPEDERTVAMDIAYSQVLQSRRSLAHAKEITDRTEGKAPQFIEQKITAEVEAKYDQATAQEFAEFMKQKTKK